MELDYSFNKGPERYLSISKERMSISEENQLSESDNKNSHKNTNYKRKIFSIEQRIKIVND